VMQNKRAVYKYASRAPDWDIIIVMVNDTKYGGSGATIHGKLHGIKQEIPAPVYAAGNERGIRIAFHELGHSLANLADEYVDERIAHQYSMQYVKNKPNIDTTKDLKRIKWRVFLKKDPKAKRIIGAYEGAYYRKRGVFRPQKYCRMRSLNSKFCHICRKALVRSFHRICRLKFDVDAYHQKNPVK